MQGVPGQLTVAEVRARDGAEFANLGAKAWGLGLRHWTNKRVRAFMEISRKRVACPLCGKDKPAMRDHIMRKCRKFKRERLEEGLYRTRRNGRVVPTGFDIWFGKEEWPRTQNFCMRVAERIRPANFRKRGQGRSGRGGRNAYGGEGAQSKRERQFGPGDTKWAKRKAQGAGGVANEKRQQNTSEQNAKSGGRSGLGE
ncbi:hypothetical protein BDZ91DRAFT_799484 [Kalaharituber pfeilii]|nr:hypothetical protein BDZ91DRAFT_799484 [Kalaharituber pfeilii]